jgi:hypothetical protein
MAGILTYEDIFRFVGRNRSVFSGFITGQVFPKNEDMAELFNTSLLDDIWHRRL